MIQFFHIAIRNLIKNRTRSLILASAIMIVTMLLVVLLAITDGVQKTMFDNATTLLSGHVNIAGFFKISQSSATPLVTDYQKLMTIAKESVPEAHIIIDRVKGYGKIISEADTVMVPIWGVNVQDEKDILGRLALAPLSDYIENSKNDSRTEGNILDLAKPGSLAIFAVQAKKLKVKVGDMVTVSMPTYRNMSNTKDVKVVAILKNIGMMSNFSVFLNAADTREIYQMKETASGQVMLFLKDKNDVPKIEERLRKVISGKGYTIMEKDSNPFWMKFEKIASESWTGQQIDITTWEDETSFIKWVVDIFHVLTYLLTIVLLIIIVLGLTNALWMSIKERTSEVGTLRAIGLQKRQVLLMFLIESMILTISATGAGILFGLGISTSLQLARIPITSEAFQMFLMSDVLTLRAEPASIITAFIVITFFVTVGSIFPAYRASKMKPITAINHIN